MIFVIISCKLWMGFKVLVFKINDWNGIYYIYKLRIELLFCVVFY